MDVFLKRIDEYSHMQKLHIFYSSFANTNALRKTSLFLIPPPPLCLVFEPVFAHIFMHKRSESFALFRMFPRFLPSAHVYKYLTNLWGVVVRINKVLDVSL